MFGSTDVRNNTNTNVTASCCPETKTNKVKKIESLAKNVGKDTGIYKISRVV